MERHPLKFITWAAVILFVVLLVEYVVRGWDGKLL